MSAGKRLKSRLRNWALHHWAVPLLNRELKERGCASIGCVAATDRLFPYKALTETALSPTAEILSDQWSSARAQAPGHGCLRRGSQLRVHVGLALALGGPRLRVRAQPRQRDHDPRATPDPADPQRRAHPDRHLRHQGEGILHLKAFDGHHSLGDIGASSTVGRLRVPVTTLDQFAMTHAINRVACSR